MQKGGKDLDRHRGKIKNYENLVEEHYQDVIDYYSTLLRKFKENENV